MAYQRVRCSLLAWANLAVPLFNNLFTTCILKNLPAHWTTCNHNMLSQQVTPLAPAIKQQFCCLLHQRGLEPFSLMFYICHYCSTWFYRRWLLTQWACVCKIPEWPGMNPSFDKDQFYQWISTDSAGKSALKLANLPRLKVILKKCAKKLLHKVMKVLKTKFNSDTLTL